MDDEKMIIFPEFVAYRIRSLVIRDAIDSKKQKGHSSEVEEYPLEFESMVRSQ
jgi:hypothetical protein